MKNTVSFFCCQSGTRRGGAAGIVILLIVLLVIMIGTLKYFVSEEPQKQVTGGIRDIERSADVSCSVNRNAVKTNLTTWEISNPGEPLRLDEIRQKYNLPICPRGGAYLLGPDGVVYCTKHFPPPAAMMQRLIALTTPAPSPTPLGTPTPLSGGK